MTSPDKILGEGVTFDDVLLVPAQSEILPTEISTRTRLSRRIELAIPIVSAAMDTVTDARLAIALAQEGGIGIVHRNLGPEEQAQEVAKVKRSANGIILDPVCLPPSASTETARRIMSEQHISGIPIVEDGNRLVGILTNRDLRFEKGPARPLAEVMTRDRLVIAPPDTTLEEARDILHKNKVEKLLLVDEERHLRGLITIRDINKVAAYPHASRDARGRFRVGAAIGVGDHARVAALAAAGVDVLVVDTAHGHSRRVLETVRETRAACPEVDVIAGNVATAKGTHALIEAGADGVKVGIGPGAICTTRVVSGVGVPQVTAIIDCAAVADAHGIPIIADGGIRHSGDVAKAIAAGAHAVMMGSLFAGLDESPGDVVHLKGRAYKAYRGMGSLGAMIAGSRERYGQEGITDPGKLVPEGVEGLVPLRGPLSDFVYQMVGGLRAGMGYCGAGDVETFRRIARFLRATPAALREGHPHDLLITKEAPNYSME